MPILITIKHVNAASPIINKVLLLTEILSGLAIVGGIIGVIWNAVSPTEIDILGMKVTTGHVGVAFTALGIFSLIVVILAVLKNTEKLSSLPDDDIVGNDDVVKKGKRRETRN